MDPSGEETDADLMEKIRAVLADHPVRLGVLFGSHAQGTAGAHSDVDVAVEFESDVADRRRARLSLGTDLAIALGTDDVDVVDLASVRPTVGRSALDGGTILVGDPERATTLGQAFARATDQPTRAERRERFDDVLDRLEELV